MDEEELEFNKYWIRKDFQYYFWWLQTIAFPNEIYSELEYKTAPRVFYYYDKRVN